MGQDINSLTVPRRPLREAILADTLFRRTLRNTDLEFQDIFAGRRRVGQSDSMSAAAYIKDTKSIGIRTPHGSVIKLGGSPEGLRASMEDWAQVRIPAAILVLIAGGTLYGTWRLGTYAAAVIDEYSQSLAEAATSDEGLDRAVANRSGLNKYQKSSDKSGEVMAVLPDEALVEEEPNSNGEKPTP